MSGLSINGFLSSLGGSVSQYASSITSGALGGLANSATEGLAAAMGLPGTSSSVGLTNSQYASAAYSGTYSPNSAYLVTIYQNTGAGNSKVIQGYYDAETFGFSIGGEYDAPFAQGLLGMLGAPMLEQLATVAGVKTVTKDMTALLWQGATRPDFDIPLVFFQRQDPGTGANPIIQNLTNLASLVLPTVDSNGFLNAPGPQRDFGAAAQALETQGNNLFNSFQNAGSNLAGFLGFGSNTNASAQSVISSLTQAATAPVSSLNSILNTFTGGTGNQPLGNISVTIGNLISLESVVIPSMSQQIDWQFDSLGRPFIARLAIRCTSYKIWVADDLIKAYNHGTVPSNQGNGLQTFALNSPGAISNVPAGLGTFR